MTDMMYKKCNPDPIAKATPQKTSFPQKHKTLTTARYVVNIWTETFIIWFEREPSNNNQIHPITVLIAPEMAYSGQ